TRDVAVPELAKTLIACGREPPAHVPPIRESHVDRDRPVEGPLPEVVARLGRNRIADRHGSRISHEARPGYYLHARLRALLPRLPAVGPLSRVPRRCIDEEQVVPRLVVVIGVRRLEQLPGVLVR